MSVVTSGSTRRMMLPPGPPLPPSGPPSGLNFSRCTDATPLPPRPAATCRETRSTNVGTAIASSLAVPDGLLNDEGRLRCSGNALVSGWVGSGSLPGRDDVDDPATTLGAELDISAYQREQGVIAAAAHAGAGVEVGAALAHDDLAGVDQLAAVALHAEALGVGVATVLGRRRALLVCHELSPLLRLPCPR